MDELSLRRIGFVVLGVITKNNALNRFSGMTINEIVQATNNTVKRNTVYSNIKELETHELIRQGILSGREKTYYITDKGIEIMKGWNVND